MNFGFGDTVEVYRRIGAKHGDTGSSDVHHEIDGCGIDWASVDEPSFTSKSVGSTIANRVVEVSDVILFVPSGSDILASDQVRLPDGDMYKVHGKPMRVKSPITGWDPGVEVHLKLISNGG